MSDKINKAYEVALACAAQDGLSPPELMSMVDSIECSIASTYSSDNV